MAFSNEDYLFSFLLKSHVDSPSIIDLVLPLTAQCTLVPRSHINSAGFFSLVLENKQGNGE
jgi:hypothetical protein